MITLGFYSLVSLGELRSPLINEGSTFRVLPTPQTGEGTLDNGRCESERGK